MENLDKNELIEQYLGGTLPPAEKQALETRMATDPAFRDEVELHRQLHEEFADPQKLQLRDLLGDILREPPPPAPKEAGGWLKGLGLVAGVLLAVWLGFRWLSPAPEHAPDAQEEKSAPPPTIPTAPVQNENTPPKPLESTPERPIAMANRAAFAPNRDFENGISSQIRAIGGPAELQSPAMGAHFTPENGFVKLNFRGTAPADADTAQYPLVLKIYSNKTPPGEALFRLLPTIANRASAADKWTFSTVQRLRLGQGLYYFTLERRAEEDLIFVGKFTVGTR